MKKRNKFLGALIALVALSGIASVSATYAFWASVVNAPIAVDVDDTIAVGEGQEITTTLLVGAASDTNKLVPVGRVVEADEVEYIILTHSVEWKEDSTDLATGHEGELSAVLDATSKKIGGDNTYADLVNIEIQVGGTESSGTLADSNSAIFLEGDAVTVYIKVTLTEPENKTVYDAVAGKVIEFKVNFTVLPK